MPNFTILRPFVLVLALALAPTVHAQDAAATLSPPAPARAGANWARVQGLPAGTGVHIIADHGGRTCHIFTVTDDALTCAKGFSSPSAGAVFQRETVKKIKLTHYIRSGAVGFGVGGGLGALIGGLATRTKPCAPNTFCLNGLGGGAGLGALVVGVPSAVVGGVVGGATDMTRGSAIYTRP